MPMRPKSDTSKPFVTQIVRGRIRTINTATGKPAETKLGNPVDGGGWKPGERSWQKARRQVRHILDGSE
jgi:hypothetical protein